MKKVLRRNKREGDWWKRRYRGGATETGSIDGHEYIKGTSWRKKERGSGGEKLLDAW